MVGIDGSDVITAVNRGFGAVDSVSFVDTQSNSQTTYQLPYPNGIGVGTLAFYQPSANEFWFTRSSYPGTPGGKIERLVVTP